jgi:serine protease Do
VLNSPDKLAVFELRESFGVPSLLQGTIVGQFKDSFPLPQSFPEFSSRMRALFLKYFQEQQAKLVLAMSDKLFPHAQSATLLAKLYPSFDPSLVTQDEDGSWDAHRCEGTATELPGDARVWHCKSGGPGLTLFRLQYPGTGVDERHYHDSKEFLDLLLKGINLPRLVGSQPVRITSLGPALQEVVVHDHYGRVWQMRTWSLGYADLYFITMALPTPDGYAGMATYVPSGLGDIEGEQLKFVADFLYLSYTGSLPQWQAFLQRHELRPVAFERDKLQYEAGNALHFESPRLKLDSTGLMMIGAQSSLDLEMNYMIDHGKATWDVAGVVLRSDRDKKTFIAAFRQPKPADDAAKEPRDRWEHMSRRDGQFAGTVQHDDQLTDFWIRTVAAGEGASDAARPLYEVVYNTDRSLPPREMEDIRGKLATSFKITE